jgi:N utilization substance protein B
MTAVEVESDKLFVRKLLQSSFAAYERYSAMVAENVSGWEKDRLFSSDVVLIAMGLAEVVTFPTIPVKVTINEYVEISKFYGTPKSRAFVNGLLDKLVQTLADEGKINKTGKGLL